MANKYTSCCFLQPIAFLDLDITRKNDGFITKVYRKETHTNKYINWNSNCSEETLIGSVKTLIFRAHQLCDLEEDLNDELNFLKDTFISNDFPPDIIDRVFKSYKPGELKKDYVEESDLETL